VPAIRLYRPLTGAVSDIAIRMTATGRTRRWKPLSIGTYQGCFVRGFRSLVPRCRLVKVGEDDARLLYSTSVDTLRGQLVAAGAETVLATAGAAGVVLDADGVQVTMPVVSLPGDVVDTMGAGDAVLASIVASIVQDGPADAAAWEDALERAMRVAAATVRFEGALLRLPESLEAMELDRLGT